MTSLSFSFTQTVYHKYNSNDEQIIKNILSINGIENINVDSLVQIDKDGYLTVLNLDSLGLTVIPSEIEGLSVTTLNLRYNNLVELPEEIKEISGLFVLMLGHNNLTTLPYKSCPSILKYFSVEYNQIVEMQILDIEREVFVSALIANNNKITRVDNSISNWDVGHLRLSNNLLTEIPPFFLNGSLEYLNIDSNSLCNLPDTMETWLSKTASSYGSWKSTQNCVTSVKENNLKKRLQPLFNIQVLKNTGLTITSKGKFFSVSLFNLAGEKLASAKSENGVLNINYQGPKGLHVLILKQAKNTYTRKVLLE